MDDLQLKHGMAKLIVDEQKLGDVYYEFRESPWDDPIHKKSVLSGDPMDLHRAVERGTAKLVFEGGLTIPVQIFDNATEDGRALFDVTA